MMGCSNPHPHCQVGEQPRKSMTSSTVSVNSTCQDQLIRANFLLINAAAAPTSRGQYVTLEKQQQQGALYCLINPPLFMYLLMHKRANKNKD